MNYIEKYYGGIKSGQIVVSDKVRRVFKHLTEKTNDKNAQYIYNFSNNMPGYNELRNVLFPELQAALTGQKTAKEALDSYVEKGNVVIDEGRAGSVIYNK